MTTAEDILDRLPDGVVVVGPDGLITTINRVAERLTGWLRAEATGAPYGDVVRLRDTTGGFLVHEQADPFVATSPIASGSPERSYILHRRDGGERWVAVRAAYRWNGDKLAEVVASIRDVGRRHRREMSAYDLIGTLAHDLRSPLTSVKGFTSTMLRNWDRFNDEQKQHMLNTIDFDADRMNRLLKDLLDFSRLEAGRLELKREAFDIADMARTVAERVAMDAPNHAIKTDLDALLPTVLADRGKIEQVLMNLVENAVKHGDPGSITVSGTVEDGHIVMRVIDSGPGIDARHVPYVFTKFYRRSTGERHAGTGLGLYICKGIIEAHGGQITIEKTSPSGTVFAFTLPSGDE